MSRFHGRRVSGRVESEHRAHPYRTRTNERTRAYTGDTQQTAAVNRSRAAAVTAAPAHECLPHVALAGTQKTTCLARFFLGTLENADRIVILSSTVIVNTRPSPGRTRLVLEPFSAQKSRGTRNVLAARPLLCVAIPSRRKAGLRVGCSGWVECERSGGHGSLGSPSSEQIQPAATTGPLLWINTK